MRININDEIEYNGLSAPLKEFTNLEYEHLTQIIEISGSQAPINRIYNVSVDCKMRKGRLINTGTGVSLDRDRLFQFKHILSADIRYKVKYTGKNNDGAIYTVNKHTIFYTAIPVIKEINANTQIWGMVCVDDIKAYLSTPYKININISLIYSVLIEK